VTNTNDLAAINVRFGSLADILRRDNEIAAFVAEQEAEFHQWRAAELAKLRGWLTRDGEALH
jgi:hypothetical protein